MTNSHWALWAAKPCSRQWKWSTEFSFVSLYSAHFSKGVWQISNITSRWGEGGDRGWDGWMASLTQWTRVWANLGDGEGQGSLACCSPWGHKESDTTERLNNSRWQRHQRQTEEGRKIGVRGGEEAPTCSQRSPVRPGQFQRRDGEHRGPEAGTSWECPRNHGAYFQ